MKNRLISNVDEGETDRLDCKQLHSIRKRIELSRPTNTNSVIRKASQYFFDDYVDPRLTKYVRGRFRCHF